MSMTEPASRGGAFITFEGIDQRPQDDDGKLDDESLDDLRGQDVATLDLVLEDLDEVIGSTVGIYVLCTYQYAGRTERFQGNSARIVG